MPSGPAPEALVYRGLVLEGVKDLFEENEVGCSWNADLLSQCRLTSWIGVLPPGLGVGGL